MIGCKTEIFCGSLILESLSLDFIKDSLWNIHKQFKTNIIYSLIV